MLVLLETPTGYSIFNISNSKKLKSVENIQSMFKDAETASQYVELECTKKFKDTAQAVESLQKVQNGELPKDLKKFLQKNIISKEVKENLLCKNMI